MHNHTATKSTFAFVLMALLATATTAWAMDMAQVVEESHPSDLTHQKASQTCASCESCHTCEQPTRQEPCLVNCPRYEGYFHSSYGVDDGPDVVIIDQLADLYRPVVFAHKLHAEMSNMTGGCGNCHHYSEQSGSIPSCRECHEPNAAATVLGQPSLKGAYHRQCINCHLDWAHENACSFCHEQSNGAPIAAVPDTTDIVGVPHPKIEAIPTYTYETSYEGGPLVTFHHTDHVEMFGQQCVSCHRGDSCSSCHDSQPHQRKSLDHVTSCNSCHGERDCAFCHSTQTQPNFEHGLSTGWSLEPYHTDVACNVCHGDPASFRHPQATCVKCHIHWEVGSFEHAVTGLELDENHVDIDCDGCHIDMNVNGRPACDDCHDEPMFPELIPGRRVAR
jgi:class III cytochrome C family protein